MNPLDAETVLGSHFVNDRMLEEFVSTLKPEEFTSKHYIKTLNKIAAKIQESFWENLHTHLSDKESFQGSVFYVIMKDFADSVNWVMIAEDWVLDNIDPSWYAY